MGLYWEFNLPMKDLWRYHSAHPDAPQIKELGRSIGELR
jgi:hypothetical protein